MADRDDKRGAPPGSQGNVPHERNAAAAALIERVSSYGLPRKALVDFLEWVQGGPLNLDLASQGYSEDTLMRHYRAELDKARLPAKELLMHRAYQMAMMDQLPDGVSPDRAYAVAADKLKYLLNVQHGIAPFQSHRHAGPGGGPIPIVALEALNDEELEWLERITAKLAASAAAGSDQG